MRFISCFLFMFLGFSLLGQEGVELINTKSYPAYGSNGKKFFRHQNKLVTLWEFNEVMSSKFTISGFDLVTEKPIGEINIDLTTTKPKRKYCTFITIGSDFKVVSRSYDGKSEETTFYTQTVDLEKGTVSNDLTTLLTVKNVIRDYAMNIDVEYSPDSNFVFIYSYNWIANFNNVNQKQDYYTTTIDIASNKIENNSFSLTHSARMVEEEFAINNTGTVCSFFRKFKKGPADTKVMSRILTSYDYFYFTIVNNKASEPIQIDLGSSKPSGGLLFADKQGFFIAGPYLHKDEDSDSGIQGLFTVSIKEDGSLGDILKDRIPLFIRSRDLREGEKAKSKEKETDQESENSVSLFNYELLSVNKKADGTLFWLFEKQGSGGSSGQNSAYDYRSVILLETNSSGKIVWINEFEKKCSQPKPYLLNGYDYSGVCGYVFGDNYGIIYKTTPRGESGLMNKELFEWHTQSFADVEAAYTKRLKDPNHAVVTKVALPEFKRADELENYSKYDWEYGFPSGNRYYVPSVANGQVTFLIIQFGSN